MGDNQRGGAFASVSRLAILPAAIALTLILSLLIALPSAGSTTFTGTFTASEDTHVRNTTPDVNYGQRSKVEADADPSVKRILLRFKLTGIARDASIKSARLRLFVENYSKEAGEVHAVSGAWSEASTTWNNAPAVGAKIADMSEPALLNSWREADVTSVVRGNGSVNFYIVSSYWDGVDYFSSEAGSTPPTLAVEWQTSSSPTATPTATPAPIVTATPTVTPTRTPTPTPTATPSPPAGSDPVLVGAGDIASCSSSGDEATAALLDRIPGTVFTTGDNVYDSGTTSEFADCYDPSWGRHKSRTRPAAGNHEYATAGASPYFAYFGASAGDPGKGYYSYNLGAWHLVVLNSNCGSVGGCGAGSPQEQWLRQDLAANPAVCTAALWHHPLFSSGEHGGNTSVRPLWQALYDYRADVVLNGHDHTYERFAPQNPTGSLDLARGIREFVVGTGGKSHYPISSSKPNSEVSNDDTFGVLKLSLHPTGYDWQFIPEAGKSFTDAGSAGCGDATQPSPTPPSGTTAEQLVGLLQDVTAADGYRYGTKDDAGNTMDTLKIIEAAPRDYLGVYHTLTSSGFVVKLAISTDLLTWQFKTDLGPGSQPTLARLSDGGYLLAYETNSNNLHFAYYPTLSALVGGAATKHRDVARTLSACAEGTPNIYSATLSPDIDHSVIDVGYHYFRNCDVDRQARGTLTNFSTWAAAPEAHLNTLFESLTPSIGGNVGDRDDLAFGGKPFNIHEAQYAKGDWASWRNYLYDFELDRIVPLSIKTHKGSSAFGNPAYTIVTSPDGRAALVVTYFLFSEGAVVGEGGELVFYRILP